MAISTISRPDDFRTYLGAAVFRVFAILECIALTNDGHEEPPIPMDSRSHFLRCTRSAFRFSFGHGKCYRLVPRKLSGGPR